MSIRMVTIRRRSGLIPSTRHVGRQEKAFRDCGRRVRASPIPLITTRSKNGSEAKEAGKTKTRRQMKKVTRLPAANRTKQVRLREAGCGKRKKPTRANTTKTVTTTPPCHGTYRSIIIWDWGTVTLTPKRWNITTG